MKVNLSTSDVLIKSSKSGLIQTRREVAWSSGVINRGCVFPGDIPRRWRIRVHGHSTSVTPKRHFTGFKSTQQTRARARARTFCTCRGHEVKLESCRASVHRDFFFKNAAKTGEWAACTRLSAAGWRARTIRSEASSRATQAYVLATNSVSV